MLITPVYQYSPSVIHRCIDAIVNSTYCVIYQDILTRWLYALCWYVMPVLQRNAINDFVLRIKSIVLLSWWCTETKNTTELLHDNIKWKHVPLCGEFAIHIGQWRGALMFSLICALHKQSWGGWFETPSRSLWPHCNAKCVYPQLQFAQMSFTQICDKLLIPSRSVQYNYMDNLLQNVHQHRP